MPGAGPFETVMLRYFAAEKGESALFLLIGIAALAASILLWRGGGDYRGMLYPLAAIGLIQIVVGGTVFFRTDSQVEALRRQLASDPVALRAAELPRMRTVMTSFKVYKAIEIGLLLTGIALSFLRDRNLLYAIAVGLILQSSIMLVLDLFAEHRGERYIEAIQSLPEA